MHFEERSQYSGHLGREMRFNVYGHAGKPIIVFPSSGGSYHEYADFGMIEACSWFIDQGLVRFYTPDSIDNETWLSSKWAHDKGVAHQKYEDYIIDNLIPLIKHETGYQGPMITTGASMGAYHALNFLLQHPDVFDTCIALSGVYDVRFFVGDIAGDPVLYQNSPVDYIWTQDDPWFLEHYRRSNIILCTGLGKWEEQTIHDTDVMKDAFEKKGIPAWVDYWGSNVDHDWVWWRQQMPYFLGRLFDQGKLWI